MSNYFKRYERHAFAVLLVVTVFFIVEAVVGIALGWSCTGKLMATAGLLSTLTGIFQLEVAGLFTKLFDLYGDDINYPYGPPSHITREIIDNPETPVRTWLRTYAFFTPATGFWFIITGTLIQVLAVWL